MAWCKTCHYGSATAVFKRCPLCGATHFVNVVTHTVPAVQGVMDGKTQQVFSKSLEDGQTDKCPYSQRPKHTEERQKPHRERRDDEERFDHPKKMLNALPI